jgi:hypothetical protein
MRDISMAWTSKKDWRFEACVKDRTINSGAIRARIHWLEGRFDTLKTRFYRFFSFK